VRNKNTVMTNTEAIDTEQHGGANNEKIKLQTLVRSFGANLQAIIRMTNCFTD